MLNYKNFTSVYKLYDYLIPLWIFTGIMGRLIPLFFIPAIKSTRPHFFVAAVISFVTLVNFLLYRNRVSISLYSLYFLSLLAWFCFIGIAVASFLNLDPLQIILYKRAAGYDSPFIKWVILIIFIILCTYFYNAAFKKEDIIEKIVRNIDRSFVIFFLIGWPLYIATAIGKISRETYLLFTVQTKAEAVFPRFYPGDYANGMGELLGFYIIFLVLMRRHINHIPLKFLAGFAGLLLTTTRAAIIPVLMFLSVFLIYVFLRKLTEILKFNFNVSKKYLFMIFAFVIGSVLLFLVAINIEDVSKRIYTLYKGIIYASESRSVQKRFLEWEESLKLLKDSVYLGTGFGTRLETHNVVIQLLSEVGIVGTFFYVMFILLRVVILTKTYLQFSFKRLNIEADFIRMIFVAIPVNIFFAMTNHNLYHFTFWLLMVSTFSIEAKMNKRCHNNRTVFLK